MLRLLKSCLKVVPIAILLTIALLCGIFKVSSYCSRVVLVRNSSLVMVRLRNIKKNFLPYSILRVINKLGLLKLRWTLGGDVVMKNLRKTCF